MEAVERHQEFFIPIILSNIALHETVESGESMLPSESVETGDNPKMTIPQTAVPPESEADSVMHVDESTTTSTLPGNLPYSDEIPHLEHPTEDAISAQASMAV